MPEYLLRTSHRPRSLPSGRWAVTQRWTDLLFAHWPLSPSVLAPLLPEWLEVDTHQGMAWLGVVPFWLDRIRIRGVPPILGALGFPDLTLRTYVRDHFTSTPGIYCFSLDSSNLLAVAAARTLYHLPYHWASMKMDQQSDREIDFFSRRRFAGRQVIFKARYRGLGPSKNLVEMRPGSLEHFLTERSCLFSCSRSGQPSWANLHYIPWPLEDAEADIERNDLPAAIGIKVPDMGPVLHYSRRLAVYLWQPEILRPTLATRPVTAVATPLS